MAVKEKDKVEEMPKISSIELKNGTILYSRFPDKIKEEIKSKYEYSHYDLHVKAKKLGPSSYMRKDNFYTAGRNRKERIRLTEIFKFDRTRTILEIGAFQGFGTVKLCQKNKFVIAVEPIKENFDIIQKNIEVNKIENIELHNKGIWSSICEVNLRKEGYQGDTISEEFKFSRNKIIKTDVKIQTITIDEIIKDRQLDIILMECNGSEIEALRGAKNTLKREKLCLISLGYNYDFANKIYSILKEYNFQTIIGPKFKIYGTKGY